MAGPTKKEIEKIMKDPNSRERKVYDKYIKGNPLFADLDKKKTTKDKKKTTKGKKKTPIKDAVFGKDKGPRMSQKQVKNQANVRPLKSSKYGVEGPFPESLKRRTNPDTDVRGQKGRLARQVKAEAKANKKGGKNFPKTADSKQLKQVKRRLDKVQQGKGDKKMVRSQAHDKGGAKNYKTTKLGKFLGEEHNFADKALRKDAKDKKTGAPHLKRTSTYKFKNGGMLKKPTNPGLKKLPSEVRNKMGFMKKGGSVKGKCKVDGIAVRGRTRAKHK
jgi:hypothetical protein